MSFLLFLNVPLLTQAMRFYTRTHMPKRLSALIQYLSKLSKLYVGSRIYCKVIKYIMRSVVNYICWCAVERNLHRSQVHFFWSRVTLPSPGDDVNDQNHAESADGVKYQVQFHRTLALAVRAHRRFDIRYVFTK